CALPISVVGVLLVGAGLATVIFAITQVHRGFELQPVIHVVGQVLVDVVLFHPVSQRPLHAVVHVAVTGANGNTALVVLGVVQGSLFRRVREGTAAWVAQVGRNQGAAVQATHIQFGAYRFTPYAWHAGVGPAIGIVQRPGSFEHHHRGALLVVVRANPVDAVAE